MKKFYTLLFLFIITVGTGYAQPYRLQSVGVSKPFMLDIFFGEQGKGAFVQYIGQKNIIALRIKSVKVDTTGRSDGQPDVKTYIWNEIIDGQINGTYGLVLNLDEVTQGWYVRKRDAKGFNLTAMDTKGGLGNNQYFLNGTLISFNHFSDNRLTFEYPDKQKSIKSLPEVDSPNPFRRSYIADYNFDGYDDIAFSIPDAGMGVYQMFSIWLFNPASKRYEKLAEPNYSKGNCGCLCDVTLDSRKKLLFTSCRGSARWWQDVYRYVPGNKLVFVRSKDEILNH